MMKNKEMAEATITLKTPLKWQNHVYNNRKRFTVVMASRRLGKSLFTQRLVTEYSLQGKRVLVTFPTYKMCLSYYEEIERTLKPAIISSNKSDKIIEVVNGGKIEMYSLDTTSVDSIRGKEFDLYIGDEVAYCDDFINSWDRVIRPTLTTTIGDAVFVSTPNGMNDFYKLYQRGTIDNITNHWISFKYTIYDGEHINAKEIEDIKAEISQAAFDQEYLCEIGSSQNNPFRDNIYKNELPTLSTKPAKWYGIDLASVVDYTVIIGLDENTHMSHFDRFQLDWDETEKRILQLPKNVNITLDATGVGRVVLDKVSKKMPNIQGFIYTIQSKKPLIDRLIKAVEVGEVKYNDATADEMNTFEFRHTPAGVKYNAKSGYHDDCINALALALASKDRTVNYGKYNISFA